jgi:glycosyltransferase involved in cell wall biosynthesis
VVGIARSILEDLETRGILPEKLFHVPNGVDVSRFAPRPRDEILARELGVDQTPALGFLGTLFPWEGVSWLVRAAAELKRKGQHFKLLIVGDGADAPAVKRVIEELHAADYINYLGRVPHDQVERYYSVMDVLVYPRRSVRLTELVTPLKPLEAMALGKAVLGSSVGGIRELIEPEVTGELFAPGDIGDFCRQASRLLKHETLRRSLGEQARLRVSAEKDWQLLAKRYEVVYDAAIRNARSRSRSR